MRIKESRKVQQIPNKSTYMVTIPKTIACLLGVCKNDDLEFEYIDGVVTVKRAKSHFDL